MSRLAEIIESRPCVIDITDEDARLLNRLGSELASSSIYWGTDDVEDSDSTTAPGRSVINCSFDGVRWKIVVRNAVGVIKVSDLQISVKPKIPLAHFVYILSFSDLLPRFVTDALHISESDDLLELIAHWFVYALEGIIRRDLVCDYTDVVDELKAIRGQLDPLPTAANFYAGRLEFQCEFADFSMDTPLNRVLRAAAARVRRDEDFGGFLRRRAFRALERMGPISELRPSDLMARPDRRTAHYTDGVNLARLLLASESRTIEHGRNAAWSFLIPTAGAVEDGIRSILAEGLHPVVEVKKGRRQLHPSTLTVNPDLVFSRASAVGDVKYKIYDDEWSRADLYQIVAFATAYGAKSGIVVSFRKSDRALPRVPFDRIEINGVLWNVDCSPADAARELCSVVDALVVNSRDGVVAPAT